MFISRSRSLRLHAFLLISVTAFCLIGIYWRPLDQLSTLWPANALLLGVFLRVPQMAAPTGWLAAAAGYVLADLLTGNTWLMAVALNLTNLLSVAVALALSARLDDSSRRLTSPGALPRLFLAISVAPVFAGLMGGGLLWHFFDKPLWSTAANWAASEWLSYVVLMPTILTVPAAAGWRWRERRAGFSARDRLELIPLACLLLSLLATLFIGGPGALAFPVIALLACALVYGLFATAVLTLASSLWTLLGITFGSIPLVFDLDQVSELISVRLGVGSIALAPIAVASVMAARETTLVALRHLAEHDPLTDLLNRRTFQQRAEAHMARAGGRHEPAGVLMIDIDHFKRINDTYGHAMGDEVLRVTANKLRQALRVDDLCGRVGGEEFAVVIADCTQAFLEQIAQRLHDSVTSEVFAPDGTEPFQISLSIGATLGRPASESLETMLLYADQALYEAKNGGRNQSRFR